jgi:ABC-type spermidine/putrescine transport system permease subunit I
MSRTSVIRHTPGPVLLGGASLLIVCALLYWGPLLAWLIKHFLTEPISLPRDFPFWSLVLRTGKFSLIAAAASTIASYPLVLVWRFSGSKVSKVAVNSMMLVPMIMGLLARNYSWIGMLSEQQALSHTEWPLLANIQLLYTPFSVYVVMSCIFVPIAFFVLVQSVAAVSQYHIDAARTLGLPDWKILFRVVLPLTYRGAALAFGLILALSTGYFITPQMIGGGKVDFISNAILISVNQGRFGQASMLAVLFLLVMAIPAALITWFAIRRRLLVSGR